MSEQKRYTGTLREVADRGMKLEDLCESLCDLNGYGNRDRYESWEECLSDNGSEKFVVANDSVYTIDLLEESDDEDIFHSTKNADGLITFVVSYYNGGCSFSEAISEALIGGWEG